YASDKTYGCSAGHAIRGSQVARCAGGGADYGTPELQPLIGGSGGSGGYYINDNQGAGGGAGGGAIRISRSGTLLGGGTGISANGGSPGAPAAGYNGGAGSGGAIHLQARTVTVQADVLARGSGQNVVEASTDGRIRIDADVFNHTGGVVDPVE